MPKFFLSISDPDLVEAIKAGAVGVMPTDTVYGIVGSAFLPEVFQRLSDTKHRSGRLGTIIAASIDQLVKLGLETNNLRAVEYLWPNPVSVVLPAGPDLDYLHHGVGSLAVRIPKGRMLRRLLAQTGPLVTTSANLADQATAKSVQEAQAIFGNEVDFYVEGGTLDASRPSTIVEVSSGGLKVLRQGTIRLDGSDLAP